MHASVFDLPALTWRDGLVSGCAAAQRRPRISTKCHQKTELFEWLATSGSPTHTEFAWLFEPESAPHHLFGSVTKRALVIPAMRGKYRRNLGHTSGQGHPRACRENEAPDRWCRPRRGSPANAGNITKLSTIPAQKSGHPRAGHPHACGGTLKRVDKIEPINQVNPAYAGNTDKR
jgi:hypothetical protein